MSTTPDRLFEYLKTAYDQRIAQGGSVKDSLHTAEATPDDLRSTTVGDDSVHAIWAKFGSPTKKYATVYVPHHVQGPYVLLSSPDKDLDNFREVEGKVAELVDGKIRGVSLNSGADVRTIIELKAPLTQSIIADSITRMQGEFPDYGITDTIYRLVNSRSRSKRMDYTPTSLGVRLGVESFSQAYTSFSLD